MEDLTAAKGLAMLVGELVVAHLIASTLNVN
jgi:hypothetical protein